MQKHTTTPATLTARIQPTRPAEDCTEIIEVLARAFLGSIDWVNSEGMDGPASTSLHDKVSIACEPRDGSFSVRVISNRENSQASIDALSMIEDCMTMLNTYQQVSAARRVITKQNFSSPRRRRYTAFRFPCLTFPLTLQLTALQRPDVVLLNGKKQLLLPDWRCVFTLLEKGLLRSIVNIAFAEHAIDAITFRERTGHELTVSRQSVAAMEAGYRKLSRLNRRRTSGGNWLNEARQSRGYIQVPQRLLEWTCDRKTHRLANSDIRILLPR